MTVAYAHGVDEPVGARCRIDGGAATVDGAVVLVLAVGDGAEAVRHACGDLVRALLAGGGAGALERHGRRAWTALGGDEAGVGFAVVAIRDRRTALIQGGRVGVWRLRDGERAALAAPDADGGVGVRTGVAIRSGDAVLLGTLGADGADASDPARPRPVARAWLQAAAEAAPVMPAGVMLARVGGPGEPGARPRAIPGLDEVGLVSTATDDLPRAPSAPEAEAASPTPERSAPPPVAVLHAPEPAADDGPDIPEPPARLDDADPAAAPRGRRGPPARVFAVGAAVVAVLALVAVVSVEGVLAATVDTRTPEERAAAALRPAAPLSITRADHAWSIDFEVSRLPPSAPPDPAVVRDLRSHPDWQAVQLEGFEVDQHERSWDRSALEEALLTTLRERPGAVLVWDRLWQAWIEPPRVLVSLDQPSVGWVVPDWREERVEKAMGGVYTSDPERMSPPTRGPDRLLGLLVHHLRTSAEPGLHPLEVRPSEAFDEVLLALHGEPHVAARALVLLHLQLRVAEGLLAQRRMLVMDTFGQTGGTSQRDRVQGRRRLDALVIRRLRIIEQALQSPLGRMIEAHHAPALASFLRHYEEGIGAPPGSMEPRLAASRRPDPCEVPTEAFPDGLPDTTLPPVIHRHWVEAVETCGDDAWGPVDLEGP